MTLSTVDTQGVPKARVVLLKEFTQEGFVFYTNYTSGKAQAIAQNNKVCISFFWPSLERQIIITGMAVKISEEKSIAYFNKRPRESQLGAVVSDQSTSIDSRVALEEKLLDLEKLKLQQIQLIAQLSYENLLPILAWPSLVFYKL